ncbi:FAD-dependent oxidoreductase [Sphingobium sp. CFD-2]|uniref:FAD-dependent oxidoreductase n=1 Tax=Sphingobium sp. CFD-2 TaxID=2878542 RepID=UPI00214CC46D|nr:FAD-dependent oxidoreductase [Sphingobium sp. CFD-2]
MDNDAIFDLVVVGSGAAGLTAAIVAASHGLSVLVIEKGEKFGGTTARSGAVAWIPNNPHMAPAGLPDSLEQADSYLRDLMGNYYDGAKIGAFLRHGPDMIRMMEANSAVRFDNWHSLDYEPSRPGAARGRSIGAAEFDGRRLGKDLAMVSPGLPNLTILGGMQVGYADVAHFGSAFRSRAAFSYTARKIGRYVRDLLVHRRPTRLVGGNALIGALLFTAREKAVTLWPSTSMIRLHLDEERVSGVLVQRDGVEQLCHARHGVVLATGGYGGNDAMRRTFLPFADAGRSLQPDINAGDGIQAGEQAGGHVVADNIANGIWAALSTMPDRHGRPLHHPHIFRDRAFPGFMLVDQDGHRFVNEGVSYQELGNVMIRRGTRSAWLICCHSALRNYGMGHVKPAPLPYKAYIRSGYLKAATTIPALAEKLGIPLSALDATVQRFNDFARNGVDPDFGKGQDTYTAEQGDPQHRPDPTLGPVAPGPFYAVEIKPGEFCTINGLDTDASARVLDGEGEPIAGLYAIGIDSNSVFRGAYPGGGASIGPAMTFAYIAAIHAASC